jgi:hypothetical protein
MAGASLDMIELCGAFHGTIAAATPSGSRRTVTSPPVMPRVLRPGEVPGDGRERGEAGIDSFRNLRLLLD